MARKATVNLAAMSGDELLELRSEIDRRLVQRRAAMEKELSRLGATVANGGGRASMKGTKVPPKYRGPKGEHWTGRGMHPRWLAALLKQGHKIEEYVIGKRVASRMKTPTRRSAKKRTTKKSGRKRG